MKDFDYCPEDVELEFDWLITNQCNFHCDYCYPGIRRYVKDGPHFARRPVDDVVSVFNNTGKVCHLIVSGGEPFMYPDFVDFVDGMVASRHYVSVFTNLALPAVWDFSDRIDPERVPNLFPALHILEREKRPRQFSLDEFSEKVVALQAKGFNVHCIYVLYPPLLERFEEDIDRLRRNGVLSVNAKVFKGYYEGVLYPDGYSARHQETLERVASRYPHNLSYIAGIRDFRGLRCNAGKGFLKIAPDGEVYRCASIQDHRGNIYTGEPLRLDKDAQPCTAKRVLTLTNCMKYLVDRPERASIAVGGRDD